MSARILAALLLFAAAGSAGAQSFVTMGRLFTTPSERAQLDQARNSGTTLPGAAGGPGGIGAGATSTGGAIAPMAAGAAGSAPGTAGATAGTDGSSGAATGPESVRLSGIIRRSGGRTTVFVNDEAHDGHPVNQGKAARVNVDGRSVVLKPGQSYEPATGAINEPDR
jgi:hypothetical protein